MTIDIRLEQPADYRKTENMTREAFWNHFIPGCDEPYLVHIMRDSPAFVPELDFVAVDGDKIVGNAICVKAVIQGDDGQDHEVLTLGPLAVLPEYQRQGIGGKLIERTKQQARNMGFRAIVLFGDPNYYSKHGFIPAEQLGIRTADNMYMVAHQVCELSDGALAGVKGRYLEDKIYEVDAAAAAEFDKGFPAKERISGTPSQQRFEELVALRKPAN